MPGRKLRMSDFEKTLNEEGKVLFGSCPTIFLTCILTTPVLLGGTHNIETLRYYHDEISKVKTPLGFGSWLRIYYNSNFKDAYSTWINAHA